MNAESKYPLWWAILVFALGAVTAFRPFSGIDAHWHLAMGQAYLEHGLWLDHDPISYLSFVRAVDMGAWGGQVLFAFVHRFFGWAGINSVVALVAAACHLVVFNLTWKRSRDIASSMLVVAVFAAAAAERWRGRPDVFSILFFIVMVALLNRSDHEKKGGLLYGGLALIWINFHPGAIVMPGFAIVAAFCGQTRKRMIQAGCAAVALLVTPRGPIELCKLVYHTVTTGSLVPEWRPLWQQPFEQFQADWFLLAVVVAIFLMDRPWRNKRGIPALALLMTIRSFRLSYMLMSPVWLAMSTRPSPRRQKIYAALAVVLILWGPVRKRSIAFNDSREIGASPWTGIYEPAYPVGSADFIESRKLEGNLFHPVGWGGYLGWRLAPRNKSAHDGRISEWGFETAKELLEFQSPQDREKIRAKLGFEISVVSLRQGAPFYQGKELEQFGGRWRLVYSDNFAAVFIDTQGPHWSVNKLRLGQ